MAAEYFLQCNISFKKRNVCFGRMRQLITSHHSYFCLVYIYLTADHFVFYNYKQLMHQGKCCLFIEWNGIVFISNVWLHLCNILWLSCHKLTASFEQIQRSHPYTVLSLKAWWQLAANAETHAHTGDTPAHYVICSVEFFARKPLCLHEN